MRSTARATFLLVALVVVGAAPLLAPSSRGTDAPPMGSAPPELRPRCEYWVAQAPAGSDRNPGTFGRPWATIAHAAETVLDANCTVWFADGSYPASGNLERRFRTVTSFRAVNRYGAALVDSSIVLKVNGATNMIFSGFQFRHVGPGAVGALVYVDGSDAGWAEHIVLRDNIFHDSYDDDLLKLHNASRDVIVEGNVFYNQGDYEEQIDVNSVSDVVIERNIFFNDFARSLRPDTSTTKCYVTVKDSNAGSDGVLGSRRVAIRRNIFLRWEGGMDSFVTIGADGKPFHEAQDVRVENNLMIGNSADQLDAGFTVSGAKNVAFVNNTVVGDLPARSYAFRISVKGLNPLNENIIFANNLWSDPTASMGSDGAGSPNDFSDGDRASTIDLRLLNNLYWNGGAPVPDSQLLTPLRDDRRPIVADPMLSADQQGLIVPYWTGSGFLSGARSIDEEFVRLAVAYGAIPVYSPAVGRGLPALSPTIDIVGRARDGAPDLGAFEADPAEAP